jgi:large subunit ribosomal protein L19e
MTDLRNQRRMAASLLKCGVHRVWIDPASLEEIQDAVTRSDIRSAIHAGVIRKKPVQGVSRVRARRFAEQRRRGRHSGPGSRKGSPLAREPAKRRWIRRIRPQRDLLRQLRQEKKISPQVYREFYRRAKGGMFRSRSHLLMNLRLAGALPLEA